MALDVYEEEEGIFFEDLSGQVLQDDELARLLTFPNVLITAHQAFLTREALGGYRAHDRRQPCGTGQRQAVRGRLDADMTGSHPAVYFRGIPSRGRAAEK